MTKPFFKWPGSKSWLINRLSGIIPGDIKRIIEPFSGSAAFFLGSDCNSAVLADTNSQIAHCLTAVRDNPNQVIKYLSKLTNTREDYLRVRNERPSDIIGTAGRIIFLTNTSWGGLYRENRQGEFNVPFGDNGRIFFCEDTILAASNKLRGAEIYHSNFDITIEKANRHDLVFIDAPYVTKTTAEFFDRYHSSRYCWNDQLALAQILKNSKMKKKKMLITCAADADLYELFDEWSIVEFSKRNSMTAYKSNTGNRKEALLISPALHDLAEAMEEQNLGVHLVRSIK